MATLESSNRFFLHDAIAEILMECDGCTADCEHIASANRRKGLYLRPKDDRPPEAWQIRRRARHPRYSHMFEILKGDRVRLTDEWRCRLTRRQV